jgi:hypothetical protein
LFDKWHGHGKTAPSEINMPTPAGGVERVAIAPAGSVETLPPTPANGAIRAFLPSRSTPANGDHLDKPFCTGESLQLATVQPSATTAATLAQTAVNDIDGGQIARVRERDLDPALYDPTTGEFCASPATKARQQKRSANCWVKTALAARGR